MPSTSAARRELAPAIGRSQNPERGFDHAPHRQLGRRAERVEKGGREPHPIRALHLRQRHRVDREGRGNGNIGMPPDRVEPVYPQDQLARRVAAFAQRRSDIGARRLLGLRRDRVLKVEDQPVRRQGPRLVERARFRAGGGTARCGAVALENEMARASDPPFGAVA